ncbi:hypothetical protein BKA25_004417 [Actinoalloteichus hymeniacidonis]|uniref:Uncharacterized protein n=1 Tax=Actinoalloteichus hymeniacidonis TaxID=340345 RepID=A0AAC9HM83_9PSEU|nr:hypothetical protein TL08_05260 [Actinoalloteichus hymeniacidonis]MBB5910101.1 hypothetical protein [Actinoalloteichus hymeniacidonis]
MRAHSELRTEVPPRELVDLANAISLGCAGDPLTAHAVRAATRREGRCAPRADVSCEAGLERPTRLGGRRLTTANGLVKAT